jgi:NAD(P)-dependent dehydrogenase (short-subunit alcohol dehydrogenase family)
MQHFQGKTAVITGAASGFGLELAKLAAQAGMNLALADVQKDALDAVVAQFKAQHVPVIAHTFSVANAAAYKTFADDVLAQWGAPNLVFNNAGVGAGGLIWETTTQDWEWVMGVNVWGVVYGIQHFVPAMLAAAKADSAYQGHVVNTASMAGLLNAPFMGVYNVSKHAVVSLSETLYQDLKLVTEQVQCSVLCPYFVPTGISASHRNRPADLPAAAPTKSQLIAQANSDKAVSSGKVTATEVAQKVMDAVGAGQFYIYSHPQALGNVQTRMEDIVQGRNPTDPFASRPDIGEKLKTKLND